MNELYLAGRLYLLWLVATSLGGFILILLGHTEDTETIMEELKSCILHSLWRIFFPLLVLIFVWKSISY